MSSKQLVPAAALAALAAVAAFQIHGAGQSPRDTGRRGAANVRDFGAVGDGRADDTAAVQRAVDAGAGGVVFPRGNYRLTRPVDVDLDKLGFTSLVGDGTARIIMAGPGAAFRIRGTHNGTADPHTVADAVWQRQRAPRVEGLELVGEHADACGVEAQGVMQLTLTHLVVRQMLHAVHLVRRNRNVIIASCHLYENRGAGVFYDQVNLHQSNITGCHISYNRAGGVVIRGGDVRNVQIAGCDIEANMADDGPATANVLLDSTGGSIAEVAIVGCTIQHAHTAPGSANIRYNGQSTPRPFTDELRHGYLTIADNVLSDVQINIDLTHARGVTVTGNTIWKGYEHDLLARDCASLVIADNVFDRNPRYHYGDGASARQGLELHDCNACLLSGNIIHGTGDVTAAVELSGCRNTNVVGNTVLATPGHGLRLRGCAICRVSDCLIRDAARKPVLAIEGAAAERESVQLSDNLLEPAEP